MRKQGELDSACSPGLRLSVGVVWLSTRVGGEWDIPNRDTNVTSTNFPKEERRSKEEDERTNGSTKLRNIKKVEIALSLRIANVPRFMVLYTNV
ncbi:hypothetical protein V1477_013927 [Vespula maculifrons]|uniref:Uncharacterized protein n=1 Tax=Vespula maculifrons TaxID=7453 RepID=A0ABD2BPP9_VESMC